MNNICKLCGDRTCCRGMCADFMKATYEKRAIK